MPDHFWILHGLVGFKGAAHARPLVGQVRALPGHRALMSLGLTAVKLSRATTHSDQRLLQDIYAALILLRRSR
jgi:hypothetical protein